MVSRTLLRLLRRSAQRLLLAVMVASAATAQAQSDDGPESVSLSWDREIQPLIARHCYHCHRDEDASGDVNLKRDENPRSVLRNRKQWETALEMLRSEQMPPEEGRRLDSDDREKIVTFLDAHLNEIDCEALRDPATPSARRLTRHEYNLAVKDLTGLSIRPADDFPPEPISFGFVGIGAAAGLSPVEVEQYYAAAETIVKEIEKAAQSDPKIKSRFFGEGRADDHSAALNRVGRFAQRAFRGPVDESFMAGLKHVYETSFAQNADATVATKNAMTAILMSPRFFMRIESAPDGEPQEDAYPVSAHDLASRLSFFLWSSPPDKKLRELAANDQLLQPEIYRQQVQRMLKDHRVADGLVRGFFSQWLQLRDLTSHQVNATAFPTMNASLSRSMRLEVERTLTEIVQEDRPITDLIDADFTYLDEQLADHYGIPTARQNGFQRVQLNDRRRGGVVVSAALLTLQSDPGRTNVPRRGNYIAGTFFGDPPPPPPPDVPVLVTTGDTAQNLTLRELLEKHRSQPECAACHAKMDPLGFALENYDAIGRWRTEDAGHPIDASGELPGYETFTGPEGLKDLLIARKHDLAQTLTENLLIYALGRGPREIDPCVIKAALDSLEENDDRFSALVIAITESFPFTHRSDPAF